MALYRIAGLTVEMHPHHRLTASRAEPYSVEHGIADMCVSGEGDANEEYAHLARSFYAQLVSFEGFLLHASAVEYDGKAVAFSAPSGTGKSTHAAYWRSVLGAAVINDDKPAVRRIGECFCACGTPFSGKAGLSRPVCIPLYAIVFLKRADEVTVRRLSAQEALFGLLGQTLRPTDTETYDRLLSLLEQVLSEVTVFEAGVPNDPEAATLVKDAIFRNGM